MLKGKKSRIISASVAIVLVLGITAFAKQATETISVMYDNIKILIDGEEYTAKDANGNVIEPFIYNGTTYLPVRGIANAFDVDVNWDSINNTVKLGSTNIDYLSNLSYVDYKISDKNKSVSNYSKFEVYETTGLIFCQGNPEFVDTPPQTVTYKIDKKYKTFSTTLKSDNNGYCRAKFYGNEKKELYTTPYLNAKSNEIYIEFDISNQDYFYIETEHGSFDSTMILKNAKFCD